MATDRKYAEPKPLSRQEIEKAIRADVTPDVCHALISAALYDPDWKWVQNLLLRNLTHEAIEVRGAAATALGHLARVHRQVDLALVRPALQRLLHDADVSGRAQDALDDISVFVRAQ